MITGQHFKFVNLVSKFGSSNIQSAILGLLRPTALGIGAIVGYMFPERITLLAFFPGLQSTGARAAFALAATQGLFQALLERRHTRRRYISEALVRLVRRGRPFQALVSESALKIK